MALKIHLSLLRLKSYIFNPLISLRSAASEPNTYRNWSSNNDLAHAVILMALNESEYDGLDDAKTAASLFSHVKAQAKEEGPVRMVVLIQEVLRIQCSPNEPLTETAQQICNIVNQIFVIQALDKDLFKCVVLLNSLSSPQYGPVQAQVSRGLADAMKANPYTSDQIQKLLEMVQNLTNLKMANDSTPPDTMLAANI